MRSIIWLIAVAVLLPQVGFAQVACQDLTPAPISAVTDKGGFKCQSTIASAVRSYQKKHMLTSWKETIKEGKVGFDLSADGATKVAKLRLKAEGRIAKACADNDTGTAGNQVMEGLQSSYANEADPAVISSCTLSQLYVEGLWTTTMALGVTSEPWPGETKDREKCIAEVGKWSWKFMDIVRKLGDSCLKKQSKAATAGDLAPICLGSWAGGAFVPPTDSKTAGKIAKFQTKAEEAVAKKCDPAEVTNEITTMMGCGSATTVADLQACVVCNGYDAAYDSVEATWSERGTFVSNAPGSFQAAASAASDGDKLLIGAGDYVEEVTLTNEDLSVVGCGAATDDRPKIIAPVPEASGRGIQSNGFSNLLIQSFDFEGQDNDFVRTSGSEGVTYRDIHGCGGAINPMDGSCVGFTGGTRYAVFPIASNNVLVELCDVESQDDAPIYVGQSSNIVVRHNIIRDGVAAIEIENCANAEVYGNWSTNNTAGLMVFKDGSLIDVSDCHDVHHNLLENNNTPNFGTGSVGAVPTGTGILSVSDDSSLYYQNIIRGNNTSGWAMVDQETASFGPPFSPEYGSNDNFLYNNWISGNGSSVDPDRWQLGGTPLPGGDIMSAALLGGSANNCRDGNIGAYNSIDDVFDPPTTPGALQFNLSNGCTLPPSRPQCPAPSVLAP